MAYERGKPIADLLITGTTKKRGTKITFKPDTDVFEAIEARQPKRAREAMAHLLELALKDMDLII